jgi:hypothetical protein
MCLKKGGDDTLTYRLEYATVYRDWKYRIDGYGVSPSRHIAWFDRLLLSGVRLYFPITNLIAQPVPRILRDFAQGARNANYPEVREESRWNLDIRYWILDICFF